MRLTREWFVLSGVLTVGLVLSAPADLPAQTTPKVFFACYVPRTGTVYRIKEPGLPNRCFSTSHVEFSWTDGAQAMRNGDAASGDLAGAYPNPLVARLQGRAVSTTPPQSHEVLTWLPTSADESAWTPAPVPAGVADHGALTGLADDDHLQYLLADGVRASVNGFAVTGKLGPAFSPAEGAAGVKLVWYTSKAAFRAGSVDGAQWDHQNVGQYSTAMGANTTANGDKSTAFGEGTNANGYDATAMGFRTVASGDKSTAMGVLTEASGQSSTALGSGTKASASLSTAMGDGSRAAGAQSTAMGSSTLASGNVSTAFGASTTASGDIATAIGSQTVASGLISIAMGWLTRAEGDYSTAMGSGSSASGNTSTAIGPNSTASGPFSMAINGGTASGSSALAIGSPTTASGDHSVAMGSYASTNGQAGSFVFGDFSNISSEVQATAPNQFVARASGGFQLRTSGDLSTGCNLPPSSGSWDCTSSVSLKTDFEPVDGEDLLARVRQLPVQRWSYRGEVGVRHIGTFAEDFHRAFGLGPGDKTIGMIDMDGVNLAAVQALERRTRELRDRLQDRDREIVQLRAQIGEMMRRLERMERAK